MATDQFDRSITFWEKFISLIETLDMDNCNIPWDDEDIRAHGIIHLVERRELEKELTAIRDRYANTFDDLIAEHDPDLCKNELGRKVASYAQ